MKELMVRKYLFLLFFVVFFISPKLTFAQSISNINIGPSLDISRFAPYIITADIVGYDTNNPVSIGISTLNGEGGPYWDYYADGTPDPESLNFSMTYDSGTTWKKTIYPDYIYPEIFFAPSSITWNNSPSNLTVRRNDYQLLRLNNPFSMVGNMNFWIEINAVAKAANSADLQVYLVSKDKPLSFFNSDWLTGVGSSNVELVSTISRNASFNHTHSVNSSHHLITLTANSDGTIGDKHLDISGNFWIVIYNTSPNTNRGWNLRYQDTSLCNNTNGWYRGNITGWTTTPQAGCPDSHIHLLRRTAEVTDTVKAIVSAGSVSSSQIFSYSSLPNLPPNSTHFLNPVGGAYSGNLNINWEPSSDSNNDLLTYFLYLLDTNGTLVDTLSSGTTATSLNWNTTSVTNSNYGIGASVCDPQLLCSNFHTDLNFSVNNIDPIYSINSLNLVSNNSTPTTAITGNNVTLTLITNGSIPSPVVTFYSHGNSVHNSPSINYLGGNIWEASFIVDPLDSNGEITFTVNSSNLVAEYFQTTDNSFVSINNPIPTPTETITPIPTPTPTNTPILTLTPTPINTTNLQSESSSFHCSNTKPSSIPNLFQINTTSTTAKLFFTPISNTNIFYLSFSENPDAEKHGEQVILFKEGVQSHTLYFLKPNTTYYFKVRGQNGCMPGEWSNILKITTPRKNIISPISVYKYNFSNKINYPKKVLNIPKIITTPTLSPSSISTTPISTPVENRTLKRSCFLWWCW